MLSRERERERATRPLAQHEPLELIVVDPTGPVLVDFGDHFVQISVRQILLRRKKQKNRGRIKKGTVKTR